jgi:hypothetical protein
MFSSPKTPAPPPPPAPPPNPPTMATALAGPQRRNSMGGVGSTIFTSPQGLVDQSTPGRKTLLGQ